VADIDIEEIKRSILSRLAEAGARRSAAVDVNALAKQSREADARAANRLLEKSGIDPAELRAELASNRQPYRDVLTRLQTTGENETIESRKAAFQAVTDRQRTLLSRFAGRLLPLDPPSYTVLSEPILITQDPNSYVLFLQSESVDPFDSRIRVLINSENSTSVKYQFWYFWYNDSSDIAVTSGASSLTFNGTVTAECGESGIFGEKKLSCAVTALLVLTEQGAASGSETSLTGIVNMSLTGGIFSEARDSKWLNYEPCVLDFANYLVGPYSGLLITATVMLDFLFTNHEVPNDGDPANNVSIDFANERAGYFIQSPSVGLVAYPLRLL
jgi:hypothetical protein